jgi:uncharacterized OB-fold protein
MADDSRRPLPTTPARMEPFWKSARTGHLSIQRCRRCDRRYFPAVDVCNACLAADMEWVESSATGTVFSFVVMHQIYHPYFADRVPYAVVDVKLDDGPHMITTVIDCDPTSLEIGMAVEVAFERLDDRFSLPVFRPR